MRVLIRSTACLAVLAGLLVHPLQAQLTGPWAECRTDSLAQWNCARYYDGTITYVANLKGEDGTVHEQTAITVTVRAGQPTCRIKTLDEAEFEGVGMLAVDHAAAMRTGGEYEIKVWCPDEPGRRPTRRDYPGIEMMDQTAANYNTLEGKETYEHPETDEANGVSGMVTQTWRLVRRGS